MPRMPRIHYEGALYHVICRGNNREFIFQDDRWKKEYIRIIKRYKERYKFKLYAYVIMDNHVHMLIEVGKTPLSKIMQGIQQVFTQRFNQRNERNGHVFQQRYKAILCDKDEYLLTLIRYIHQNPLRIFDEKGLKYSFSSYLEYVNKGYDLIDKNFPLSLFENDINRFVEFMGEEDSVVKTLSSNDLKPTINNIQREDDYDFKNSISLNEAIEKVSRYYNIDIKDIKRRTQKRIVVQARKAVIYLLENNKDITKKELAGILNISQSSISAVLSNDEGRNNIESDLKKILNL